MKDADDLTGDENPVSIPVQISSFASKLGEEVGDKFTCYVYRVVRDEETGKTKKPFVKKYIGVEPDPLEIAEKFRGGTYAVQFVWKKQSKTDTGNKSFTLDVDGGAFPPVSVPLPGSVVPYGNPSNVSESMALQMHTIHEIADIMKTAYGSRGDAGGRAPAVAADPLEMFGGLMETMETSFSRIMSIQQSVMERVLMRNMEKQYGIAEEVPAVDVPPGPEGLIGKYAPIVNEVVSGIKTIIGFFGENLPPEVVRKVTSNDRFKHLLKDEKAIVVIGQALRREFGDAKASDLMRTFGVRMVLRPPAQIAQTPSPAAAKKSAVPVSTVSGDVKKPLNKNDSGAILKKK
jgi:hypothetical protein